MIQRVLARAGIARIYENSRVSGNKCPIRTVSLYTFTQGTQMNSLVRQRIGGPQPLSPHVRRVEPLVAGIPLDMLERGSNADAIRRQP